MTDLILASASPRRAQLLSQIGVSYQVVAADIAEARQQHEAPLAYVTRMANEKAQAVVNQELKGELTGLPILAADTTVACEGRVLEKPADLSDAQQMLAWLSGKEQVVYSAFCVVAGTQTLSGYSATKVFFRTLSSAQIDRYLATNEYRDKAGAYGIQGYGAALVERFEGSYSGVVGLSIEALVPVLDQAGIRYWGGTDG